MQHLNTSLQPSLLSFLPSPGEELQSRNSFLLSLLALQCCEDNQDCGSGLLLLPLELE